MARRRPYKERYIKELLEDGENVAVEGIVLDFDVNRAQGRVDDGTAVATIVLENVIFAEEMKAGRFVRVVGRSYISSEGRVIRADAVHGLDGINPVLYKKVKEIERRVYHEGGV